MRAQLSEIKSQKFQIYTNNPYLYIFIEKKKEMKKISFNY